MSSDGSQRGRSSPRPLERPRLPVGPLDDLKSAIYQLYLDADTPTLDEIEGEVGKLSTGLVKAMQDSGVDEDAAEKQVDVLEGAGPRRDTIKRIITSEVLPPGRADTVAVAVALARMSGRLPDQHAGRDLASLAAQVRRLWDRARTVPVPPPPARLGRSVDDCDPLDLEVHPAIQVPWTDPAAALPGYVLRAHDVRLRAIVDGMLDDGRSRLITLVGGSSTGKTRAGWELAQHLDRKQPGRWQLWHPYDPTRPQSVLADLEKAGPHTIVWLNEAQHYLMPADPVLGERVAAGLRALLKDPERGPVLVLATLWQVYWNTLSIRPTGASPDVLGQARELLISTAVTLADTFTPAELDGLAGPGVDARLRYAAEHAENGRITQYLAGAPELERRYRTAVDTMPSARAILQVAIDARRLGYPLALPHALLERAAPGYLDDHDWDTLGDDWLESALVYSAQSGKGTRGPLTRIRTRPGEPPLPGGQPCYRLADYLEQLGRTERAGVYPPESLWRAFTTTATDPDLLHTLGEQAYRRGRYQHAIWLYQQAADRGDPRALWKLARMQEHAGDRVGAKDRHQQAADRDDTVDQPEQTADHVHRFSRPLVAVWREWVKDFFGIDDVWRRAANHGDTVALRQLAAQWKEPDQPEPADENLWWRAAYGGITSALHELAGRRERAGDIAGGEVLWRQAADLGDISALEALAVRRDWAGDFAGAEALAVQAADSGHLYALLMLIWRRKEAGDFAGAEALAVQAAEREHPYELEELGHWRERFGDADGAQDLWRQAVDRGDTAALRQLAKARKRAGDITGADHLHRYGLTWSGEIASGLDFGS